MRDSQCGDVVELAVDNGGLSHAVPGVQCVSLEAAWRSPGYVAWQLCIAAGLNEEQVPVFYCLVHIV